MTIQTVDIFDTKQKIYQLIDRLPPEQLPGLLLLLEFLVKANEIDPNLGRKLAEIINDDLSPVDDKVQAELTEDSNTPSQPWRKYTARLKNSPLREEFLDALAEVRQELNKVDEYEDAILYS